MKSPERTTSAVPRSSPQAIPSSQGTGLELARGRRRTGFAKTSEGIELFYEVMGDVSADGSSAPAVAGSQDERSPHKTTLLLCDGLGCDGYVWKYLEWALAPQYRLIHFHYRGHGQSTLPDDLSRVKLSDFTKDALTVLDACGIERAVFCGHSMGVQVALEAYKVAPNRVAGLTLICGSYGHPLRTFKGSDTLESLLPLARAAVSRVPSIVSALWRRAIPTDLSYYLAKIIEIDGQRVRREDFFPYLEGVARMDPRMFMCTLAAAGQHSAREHLPHISVPTLILAGRRDSFTPMELSEKMQREIPDAELHVVEQGTHTAPIERPAEVTEVIADFLRRRVNTAPAKQEAVP